MLTGTKLENALASAKGLAYDMKYFAHDTYSEKEKQIFNELSSTMENVVQKLQSELGSMEQESPQYRC